MRQNFSADHPAVRRFEVSSLAEFYCELTRQPALEPLLDPLLWPGQVTQLYGYTGHGKSLVAMSALYAASLGRSWGPFTVTRPMRVAYLDPTTDASTLARRLSWLQQLYGPSPAFRLLTRADGVEALDRESDVTTLRRLLEDLVADVVAIDSVAGAFPRLKPQSTRSWTKVNATLRTLRHELGLGVVGLCDGFPPRNGFPGTYRGAAAQLDFIDVQMRVLGVDDDPIRARASKAICDQVSRAAASSFRAQIGSDVIEAMFRLSYGLVRDPTGNHAPTTMALVRRHKDGRHYWLHEPWSPRQRVETLAKAGFDPATIYRFMTTRGAPLCLAGQLIECQHPADALTRREVERWRDRRAG
jgi:AAA domain